MLAKESIERIAAAIAEKNDAACLVECLKLAEIVFNNLERIAAAMEAIAQNTTPDIIEQRVTDGDIGFAVAALKAVSSDAGATPEIIGEAISRLEQ